MKKNKLLYKDNEWTVETLENMWKVIDKIGREELGLDYYPPQIELVSYDQMLDAYSSVGMPVFYNHWSFGKSFIMNDRAYKAGEMGLAYEMVINSNPAVAYCMESNTATMQALVFAHACCGHVHFFKNNYLFKEWTDANGIITYLKFAKNYVSKCSETYGEDVVEELLDACHALQDYGVDTFKRSKKKTEEDLLERETERLKFKQETFCEEAQIYPGFYYDQQMLHNREVLNDVVKRMMQNYPERYSAPRGFPEENILYFIEKRSPVLRDWEKEIVRIVRTIAQYFYPQRLTKCVDSETEYLTLKGWKKIADFKKGDFVAAYDISTQELRFEQPKKYHVNPCDRMLRFVNTRTDQVVTENHTMIYVNKNTGDIERSEALSLLEKPINYIGTINTASYEGPGIGLSDDLLRLHVAFKADGSGTRHENRRNTASKFVHNFRFKRERKIERLQTLLNSANIYYEVNGLSAGPLKDQTCIKTHIPNATKRYEWSYSDVSKHDAEVIFEEIFHWDGCKNNMTFKTIYKQDADFIQFIGSMLGYRATTSLRKNQGFNPEGFIYELHFSKEIVTRLGNVEEFVPEDGKSYCFTTSTGAWLSRRSGKVVVTGNCMNEGFATAMHYTIMNTLYDRGHITDGNMLEFLHSHTGVCCQRPMSSINPYTLGFSIFMDLKRMCLEPTDEDKKWFPSIAGSKDWLALWKDCVANYRDESFILQFLSPKVIRDLQLFHILKNDEDEEDKFWEVTGTHKDEDVYKIRKELAKQHCLDAYRPNIQIADVNWRKDRLDLVYLALDKEVIRELDEDNFEKTTLHLARLWGPNISITEKEEE